jgi:hypothetical protein
VEKVTSPSVGEGEVGVEMAGGDQGTSSAEYIEID